MTTTVTANIHFDKGDAWHRWNPGDDKQHPYGVLKFGPANDANVFFKDTGQVDEVIAELVALKQEMDPPAAVCDCMADPPVITDSERDCSEQNPQTAFWCYRGGDHDSHRDTNGDEWRTDAATEFTSTSLPGRVVARCQDPGFHHPNLTGAVVDCDRPEHHAPASGGVLLPAGCDPDTAPVPGLTPKGLAALDPAYVLACGCTDDRGCCCQRCQAGRVHEPGESWTCEIGGHGKTAIARVEYEPASVTA